MIYTVFNAIAHRCIRALFWLNMASFRAVFMGGICKQINVLMNLLLWSLCWSNILYSEQNITRSKKNRSFTILLGTNELSKRTTFRKSEIVDFSRGNSTLDAWSTIKQLPWPHYTSIALVWCVSSSADNRRRIRCIGRNSGRTLCRIHRKPSTGHL